MKRASSGHLRLALAAALAVAALAAALVLTLSRSSAPAARSSKTTKAQISGSIPPYLRARLRPIGKGIRFHPPVTGSPTGACERAFGSRAQAHIELFGANKVVLLAAGIGTRAPREFLDGRLTRAACFGNVVSTEDTGVVYFRKNADVTLGTLFRAWGQPLTSSRIGSFTGGRVRVFVDGHRLNVDPVTLRLRPKAEIVVEVGPDVPPHTHFDYPPIPKVT